MNPAVPDARAPIVCAINGSAMTLAYVQWRGDVSYFVETSADLKTWSQQGVSETAEGANVTASVPIDAVQRGFMRLRVTYP